MICTASLKKQGGSSSGPADFLETRAFNSKCQSKEKLFGSNFCCTKTYFNIKDKRQNIVSVPQTDGASSSFLRCHFMPNALSSLGEICQTGAKNLPQAVSTSEP